MTTPSGATLAVEDPVLLGFADEVGAVGPVAVRGGGTRWDLGGPLAADARVLAAPAGIVEYRPEEMIVRVRAGTTVAELAAALAERGQCVALPDRGGTVGGAIAVGEDRVDVLGRGRVRDAVLQVRYVSAEGRVVTGGGPVVKNVSGFNLPKLMTGSLGTLGLFAEFVLRTNPVPAAHRWVAAEGLDPTRALDAVLRPGAVLWDGTTTWVLLEGHEPDVAAERAQLAALADLVDVDGPPPLPEHRWSMAPADAARPRAGRFVASIGVGRVWCDAPAPSVAPDPGVVAVEERLKAQFDPTGRLNPGRRVGAAAS